MRTEKNERVNVIEGTIHIIAKEVSCLIYVTFRNIGQVNVFLEIELTRNLTYFFKSHESISILWSYCKTETSIILNIFSLN